MWKTVTSSLQDFFSILADRYNVVIWMAFTYLLSTSLPLPIPILWESFQADQFTIGITITFIFHSFLVLKQGHGIYLFFCFLFILLCGLPGWQSPLFGSFSLFYWLSLGQFVWPRLGDLFVSQNFRELRASFFTRMDSRLCIYYLYIIIICSLRVFHISFGWWSFTGVCVTASLLKSPGLFSVF